MRLFIFIILVDDGDGDSLIKGIPILHMDIEGGKIRGFFCHLRGFAHRFKVIVEEYSNPFSIRKVTGVLCLKCAVELYFREFCIEFYFVPSVSKFFSNTCGSNFGYPSAGGRLISSSFSPIMGSNLEPNFIIAVL